MYYPEASEPGPCTCIDILQPGPCVEAPADPADVFDRPGRPGNLIVLLAKAFPGRAFFVHLRLIREYRHQSSVGRGRGSWRRGDTRTPLLASPAQAGFFDKTRRTASFKR